MKKLSVFILFLSVISVANAQTSGAKPDYVGHIEYTRGNFGTYNYPMKNDSVLVFIKDSTVSFSIFPKDTRNPRTVEVNAIIKEVKTHEYSSGSVLDAESSSGSYDRKYAGTSADGYSVYSIYINHYGGGEVARMVFTEENGGLRLNNMFVAELVKFK